MQSKIVTLSATFLSFAVAALSTNCSKPGTAQSNSTNSTILSRSGSLESAKTASELVQVLDRLQPRFWDDLTHTGQKEAVDAFFELRDSSEDRVSLENLLTQALEFAAVNDAIYENESLLEILEPDLSEALGWGVREGTTFAEKASKELAKMGTGKDGEFENINLYLAALEIVIDRNMTGK